MAESRGAAVGAALRGRPSEEGSHVGLPLHGIRCRPLDQPLGQPRSMLKSTRRPLHGTGLLPERPRPIAPCASSPNQPIPPFPRLTHPPHPPSTHSPSSACASLTSSSLVQEHAEQYNAAQSCGPVTNARQLTRGVLGSTDDPAFMGSPLLRERYEQSWPMRAESVDARSAVPSIGVRSTPKLGGKHDE